MIRGVADAEYRAGGEDGLSSRRRVLVGAALTAGALGMAPLIQRFVQASDAVASPSKAQDVRILQLVLQLEYTQVAFYEQALHDAGLRGELRRFAQAALGHERQHLAAI